MLLLLSIFNIQYFVSPTNASSASCSAYDKLGLIRDDSPQMSMLATRNDYRIISNFIAKYTYGNRNRQGMKISHFNGGHSNMSTKMPEIKNIISSHSCQILGISKANINTITQDINMFSNKDFKLYCCPPL